MAEEPGSIADICLAMHKSFKRKKKLGGEGLHEGWQTQAVAVTKKSVQDSLDKEFGEGGDIQKKFGSIRETPRG